MFLCRRIDCICLSLLWSRELDCYRVQYICDNIKFSFVNNKLYILFIVYSLFWLSFLFCSNILDVGWFYISSKLLFGYRMHVVFYTYLLIFWILHRNVWHLILWLLDFVILFSYPTSVLFLYIVFLLVMFSVYSVVCIFSTNVILFFIYKFLIYVINIDFLFSIAFMIDIL